MSVGLVGGLRRGGRRVQAGGHVVTVPGAAGHFL
jgi:hypothetical protein